MSQDDNEQNLWYTENLNVGQIFCPSKQKNGKHLEETREYKKGEYIYLPGEAADSIYFISSGRVKVGHYAKSGKEITKAILDEGELLGELASTSEDEKRRDFAQAMSATTLCVMTRKEMKEMMREHSGFSTFLMRIFASRILKMEKRLESLVFKDSRTRIVEFLLELAEEKGERVGYEWVVRKFLTHQEIANLTATSRQTVTTVLNDLKNDDILTFDRRRLLIRDLDRLKAENGEQE